MAMAGLATIRRPLYSDERQSNIELLQKAIQLGDVEKAKEIVSQLAKQKVCVQVQEKEDTTVNIDEEISVKIYVEDKDLSGTQMTLRLKPSTRIRELKKRMLEKHGFPPEIQKWIIGKKIVKDEDTLSRLRVRTGSAVYLYLLSPQSVGLSREEYSIKYGADLPIGTPGLPLTEEENQRFQRPQRTPSSSTLQTTPPGTQQLPQWQQRNNPVQQTIRGENMGNDDYLEPLQAVPILRHTTPNPSAVPPPQVPEVLSYADVGWTCPKCTYRNEPTRPGCEMCSQDRPDDYTMPEGINYQMTDKEKRRLQRERDAERLAEESEQERTHQLDSFIGLQGLILDDDNEIQGQRERLRLSGLDQATIDAIIEAQRVVPAEGNVIRTGGTSEEQILSIPTQESGEFADASSDTDNETH